MTSKIVETIEQDGEVINVYESGAKYNVTRGHLVAPATAGKITPENSRELSQRARTKGLLSQLKGLAKSNGVELPPDADMEQVIAGAGDTLEALTMHFADTFKKSSNLRGMAEGYRQLAAPLIGEKPEEGTTSNTMNVYYIPPETVKFMTDLRQLLAQPSATSTVFMDAIDGKIEEE